MSKNKIGREIEPHQALEILKILSKEDRILEKRISSTSSRDGSYTIYHKKSLLSRLLTMCGQIWMGVSHDMAM